METKYRNLFQVLRSKQEKWGIAERKHGTEDAFYKPGKPVTEGKADDT